MLLPVVGLGAKDVVMPPGRAVVTARLTLPVKPGWGVTVTLAVVAAPWARDREPGDVPRVNPGGGLTVRKTEATADCDPEAPAIHRT